MKHLGAVHVWKRFPGDPSSVLASVFTEGELEGKSIKKNGGKKSIT